MWDLLLRCDLMIVMNVMIHERMMSKLGARKVTGQPLPTR